MLLNRKANFVKTGNTGNSKLGYQSEDLRLTKYRKIFYAIIVVSVLLRLYGITLPLIESHQLRQAQTADVARNLYYDKMDIFHTRMNFAGDGAKPAVLEFPLMHGITALTYYVFGVHEIIGRIVSILFSIGALLFMYGLARQFLSVAASLAAMGLYGLSPMNIFFSRAFMPESSMMFFMIGAIYFFLVWLDQNGTRYYIFSLLFMVFVGLTKFTASIIFAPILAAWFFKDRWQVLKNYKFWVYLLVAAVIILGWVVWAQHVNLKNPSLAGASWFALATCGGGIWQQLLKLSFYEFVGGSVMFLLLTPIGFIGMITGLFCIPSGGWKRNVLFIWLGAILAYFMILSGANSGHIYYHLHLLPLGAILFGYSVQKSLTFYDQISKLFRKKLVIFLLALIAGGYFYGYYLFFNYMYSIRMPYVLEVAQLLRTNAGKKEIILCNEPGPASEQVMAYYSQRPIWMLWITNMDNYIQEFENYRNKGATIYVAIKSKYGDGVKATKKHEKFWAYLNSHYRSMAQTDNYLIFDLKKRKP